MWQYIDRVLFIQQKCFCNMCKSKFVNWKFHKQLIMHLYLCGICASHTKTGQFELWKDSQSENFGKVNKNLLHAHLHGLELCFYFYCIERDTFFEDFSRTVSQTNFNPQIAFYMTIYRYIQRRLCSCLSKREIISEQERAKLSPFSHSYIKDCKILATKIFLLSLYLSHYFT